MDGPKTANSNAKGRLQKATMRSSGSRTALNAVTASRSHLEPASPAVRSRNALSTLSSGVYGRGSMQRIRASQNMLDRGGKMPQEKPVQVLDADGNDVTPLSLLAPQQVAQARKGHGAGASATELSSMASVTRETVADVLNNLESMTMGSWNASVFGRSAMQGMSFSTSSRMSGTEIDDDETASIASDDEDKDEAKDQRASTAAAAGKTAAEPDPNSFVHIDLTETDTITLLDIMAVTVSNEAGEEATVVKAANDRYKEVLANRAGNENFVERGMQTFNEPQKTKEAQAAGPKKVNAECMVTQWSIYDAYHGEGTEKGDSGGKDADIDALDLSAASQASPSPLQGSLASSTHFQSSRLTGSSMMVADPTATMSRSVFLPEGDTMSDIYASVGPGMGRRSIGVTSQISLGVGGGGEENAGIAALNQDALRNSLLIMERAVVANNFEKKLIQYRSVVDAEESEQKRIIEKREAMDSAIIGGHPEDEEKPKEERRDIEIPTVDFLWSYRCELTRGRAVTFMAWNKENEDILAVAYGEQKPGPNPHAGLVLCWSVKNPEWPERIYRSKTPVTSLDFSLHNPNLLACGFFDGRIAIYDVRRKEDEPVLDNGDLTGKHRDPIWELRWVERERGEEGRGEMLVSVSTDGRVTMWLVRKGLEFTDLMSLKRVTKQQEAKAEGGTAGGAGKPGSFIARQSGGLCFDFAPKDPSTYIVGTDDSHIHRCSPSYNEQYLATYFGHTGPVNRVRYSPFLHGAFLSCSSDWTVRLWKDDSEEAIFKFQGGKDTITDIAWSPVSSTVFGCVSTDGRMEIWDLQFSVLDPAILHTVLDRQLTSIIFARFSPVVLTGDDNGSVNVYKLKRMGTVQKSPTTDSASATAYGVVDPETQAAILKDVMAGKNQTGTAAPGTTAGAASAAPAAPVTAPSGTSGGLHSIVTAALAAAAQGTLGQ